MDDIQIIHGDCLDVMAGMAEGSVAAIVSDPPYGMDWDTVTSRFSGGHNPSKREAGRNDDRPIRGDKDPFDPSPWLDFPKVILWGSNHFASRLPVGTTLVWLKRNEDAFGSFLSDAELGWMKGGHGVYCHRDLSMNSLAKVRAHPSQKPVGLMLWCLERLNLPPGSLVVDPYAGSGTTGVACIKAGLRCILIESDAQYIPVIHRRVKAAETPLFAEACAGVSS